jgi:hypothetical protein
MAHAAHANPSDLPEPSSLSDWLICDAAAVAPVPAPASPALDANIWSNSQAPGDTRQRWQPCADALWQVIEPLIPPGGTIAVVGAGNCYDLPMRRLASVAGQIDLVDIDAAAMQRAVNGLPAALAERFRLVVEDLTGGAADQVIAAARSHRTPGELTPPLGPISHHAYDLVIGDLIYGQLLYPGLLALGLPDEERLRLQQDYAPHLTTALMVRMHASAPFGAVVHIHDLASWAGNWQQPHTLERVLADPDTLVPGLTCATVNDPARLLADVPAVLRSTHYWRWPFVEGHDYLVQAVVAQTAT